MWIQVFNFPEYYINNKRDIVNRDKNKEATIVWDKFGNDIVLYEFEDETYANYVEYEYLRAYGTEEDDYPEGPLLIEEFKLKYNFFN